jgi:hypothetical protein
LSVARYPIGQYDSGGCRPAQKGAPEWADTLCGGKHAGGAPEQQELEMGPPNERVRHLARGATLDRLPGRWEVSTAAHGRTALLGQEAFECDRGNTVIPVGFSYLLPEAFGVPSHLPRPVLSFPACGHFARVGSDPFLAFSADVQCRGYVQSSMTSCCWVNECYSGPIKG